MHRAIPVLMASVLLFGASAAPASAEEPKHGGIWRIYHRDSPPSASIHEEVTNSTVAPFMPVMNNLVIYKQDVAQNSLQSIVPDLATSWLWNTNYTELTFKLREGVKWHDGKPSTSRDVKCTWDMLMGKSTAKFRKNPRQNWYENVTEVTVNGDYEASFHLKRPQPTLLALLASGYSPVYPCHLSPAEMRTHPIGTGPATATRTCGWTSDDRDCRSPHGAEIAPIVVALTLISGLAQVNHSSTAWRGD
jgi:peptide/nickel transport system substrate-binding protein